MHTQNHTKPSPHTSDQPEQTLLTLNLTFPANRPVNVVLQLHLDGETRSAENDNSRQAEDWDLNDIDRVL